MTPGEIVKLFRRCQDQIRKPEGQDVTIALLVDLEKAIHEVEGRKE